MTNRFRKSFSILPQDLRIFWTFSGDGEWVSPSVPKYSLSHFPALYKLYANTPLHGDQRTRPEDSAAVPFLREFMPILNKTLFPPKSEGEAGKSEKSSVSASAADAKPAQPESRPGSKIKHGKKRLRVLLIRVLESSIRGQHLSVRETGVFPCAVLIIAMCWIFRPTDSSKLLRIMLLTQQGFFFVPLSVA